jgi:hypothetical protein
VQQASWYVIPSQPWELEWLYLTSGFLPISWMEMVSQLVVAFT